MVKKSLIVGLGFLLLGGLTFGRNAISYLRTSVSCLQESVHQSVPVTFELERARRMIDDLKPEIAQNFHRIAREEVEVEKIARQLAKLEEQQSTTKQAVLQLKSDLESGRQVFVYAKKTYTGLEIRQDLAKKFGRCKSLDETISHMRKELEFRQAGLQSGRQKLDELLAARDQLRLNVEGLEARHKMIEVQQTASDLQIDDSQLARTKELVSDIQTRLNVSERLLAQSGDFVAPEIVLEEPTEGDLLEQITTYFAAGEPSEELATTPAAAPPVPPQAPTAPETPIVAEVEQLAEVVTP